MKRLIRKPTPKAVEFPDGILASDTTYPKPPSSIGYGKKYEAWAKKNAVVKSMEFYKTERFGWVINVLHIRNASSAQRSRGVDTSRSYAISISGEMCRVGLGPHVTERFTLYVTKARQDALQKYLDLFAKGAANANDTRDRRSTRMMQSRQRGSFLGWF